MTDTYVQLPTDGSGQKVRVFKFPEPGTDGQTYVVQEAVTLADEDGNILSTFDTDDYTTHDLLRGILIRLDCLNAALTKHYSPPDDLSY